MIKELTDSESEAVVATTIFSLYRGWDPTIWQVEGGPIEEGEYRLPSNLWTGLGYRVKSRWVDVFLSMYKGFYHKVRVFLVYDAVFKGGDPPCWRALEVVDLFKKREDSQPTSFGRYKATKVGFVGRGNSGANKGYEFVQSWPPASVNVGYVRRYPGVTAPSAGS